MRTMLFGLILGLAALLLFTSDSQACGRRGHRGRGGCQSASAGFYAGGCQSCSGFHSAPAGYVTQAGYVHPANYPSTTCPSCPQGTLVPAGTYLPPTTGTAPIGALPTGPVKAP